MGNVEFSVLTGCHKLKYTINDGASVRFIMKIVPLI